MEKLSMREQKSPLFKRALIALGIGTGILTLASCSWNDLNPAKTVTHDAELDGGAAQEILHNFPDATNIQVTHADDNPNYMSWELKDGEVCTAFASQTFNKGQTPGQLISQPYCREQ